MRRSMHVLLCLILFTIYTHPIDLVEAKGIVNTNQVEYVCFYFDNQAKPASSREHEASYFTSRPSVTLKKAHGGPLQNSLGQKRARGCATTIVSAN